MILYEVFKNGGPVSFNTDNGSACAFKGKTGDAKGNFHLHDAIPFAIYAEEKSLIFQMKNQKWTLSSEEVEVRYFHKIDEKKTYFEIISPEISKRIEYPSWWSKIPDFEFLEPEMDSDEDFFGYVYMIWNDSELQDSLINNWS